jgi:hypothetical protein
MTPTAKQIFDRLAMLCACLGMGAVAYLLTGGCEARGQVPPLPKAYRPAKGVTQGAGAALLIRRTLAVVPSIGKTNVFAWRYAPGQSNYWWALQQSPDLRTWTTIASNVTGDLEVRSVKTGSAFWRLKGQSDPF